MKISNSDLYRMRELCCGCAACFSICKSKAILMIEDSEGFEYPVVDEDKCIGCKMCIRVCPIKVERLKEVH